ncbi:hypothetical protein DdX_13312 [Ditylenchus destructor]|uniref:Uncharacterized protein n=1 Tax=Ditylenchus destructor TaxID=166010 RepID=A0AAD4MUQ4_9BILA|nr:hypothetical protein DdX_13312 [Ditylenchus destructor]
MSDQGEELSQSAKRAMLRLPNEQCPEEHRWRIKQRYEIQLISTNCPKELSPGLGLDAHSQAPCPESTGRSRGHKLEFLGRNFRSRRGSCLRESSPEARDVDEGIILENCLRICKK